MLWLLLLHLWSLLPPLPAEPPVRLEDLAAFPPRPVVQQHLAASRASREWLRMRASIDPAHSAAWTDAITDSCYLFHCWDCLDDAHSFALYGSPEQALAALRRLRSLVGPRFYYAGALPPPVAFWWHPRAD